MHTKLIEAIEAFEAALRTGGAAVYETELRLLREMNPRVFEGHEAVCAEFAMGCTEAVEHGGTLYAPGFGPTGTPAVVVIRRVRPARDL